MSDHRQEERRTTVEWQTIVVAFVIYAGWFALTALHAQLPIALVGLAGAWIIAWQGSLQHETIHGHPTRWEWLNTAIGAAPLSLWLPYSVYRRTHVEHHRSHAITDPSHDPESRYATRPSLIARLQSSLIGRLVLGPAMAMATFLADELRRLGAQPREVAGDWLPHLAGVALVIAWLSWCDISIGEYLLLFVYPGTALSLLRSFAEHRADMTTTGRAASVERAGPFALLYLNNQLHAAHHERPGLAWYSLPAYHRAHRARLTDDGRTVYRGYGEIAARFALTPQHVLVHPHHRGHYS